MSQITRPEVLAAKRDRYARAGKEPKTKIINERDELFGCHRKAAIRPGTWLRHQIPLRTEWTEKPPGFLEVDPVARCGGSLDDRHNRRFDGVDLHPAWSELRALPNRSEAATLWQIRDVEDRRPFPLCGLDSDNGGEFINPPLVQPLQARPKPVSFTRSRPYRKNDNAHIEQKNYTPVRLWFGYERYDNPPVVPLINAPGKGALNPRLNCFLPPLKLGSKPRVAAACSVCCGAGVQGVLPKRAFATQIRRRSVACWKVRRTKVREQDWFPAPGATFDSRPK